MVSAYAPQLHLHRLHGKVVIVVAMTTVSMEADLVKRRGFLAKVAL